LQITLYNLYSPCEKGGSGRRFISQIRKLLCIISTDHVKKVPFSRQD
jgi:hypothetical protein